MKKNRDLNRRVLLSYAGRGSKALIIPAPDDCAAQSSQSAKAWLPHAGTTSRFIETIDFSPQLEIVLEKK
jgi:hypothetical protein